MFVFQITEFVNANVFHLYLPTDSQLFYSHIKNIIIVDDDILIKTTSRANNTTECMEECNGFNKVGVTCMGFNFHKNSSTCRFFEDRIAPHYRYDPSLSIDLYLLLPITRMYGFTITQDISKYFLFGFTCNWNCYILDRLEYLVIQYS